MNLKANLLIMNITNSNSNNKRTEISSLNMKSFYYEHGSMVLWGFAMSGPDRISALD